MSPLDADKTRRLRRHKYLYSASKVVYRSVMGVYRRVQYIYLKHILSSEKLPRSLVDPSAKVDSTAFVAECGVVIGEGSVVGPRAVILKNSTIEKDVTIGSGAVVGGDGFICFRSLRSIIPKLSRGRVRISEGARIGDRACIDKGSEKGAYTVIGRDCSVGDAVHLAHDVDLGSESVVESGAMISGYVTLGRQVFVGKNASISNRLRVGDQTRIKAGAIVTTDIASRSALSGDLAVNAGKGVRPQGSTAGGESTERKKRTQ